MPDKKLIYKSGSPCGEIILNQPDKRNAVNSEMWRALADAAEEAAADANASVVIVRGEGEHFAAGADITEFEQAYATAESAEAYTQTMLDALDALENCKKPTIAMIRGSCVGGGCSIALACDMRFAGVTARFGVTPGKLGLVYSVADTRRLAQTVGSGNAKDLLFTGRLIDAEEALRIGLCERVYPDEELEKQVKDFALQVSATSRWSAAATKRTFRMIADGVADHDADAMAIMVESFQGADFQEGYRAFLEKRKPDFPTK